VIGAASAWNSPAIPQNQFDAVIPPSIPGNKTAALRV
jgi:hypothetical protein